MRVGFFLAVVFPVILHRASSVPHGVLPPSAYTVGHDTSFQVSKGPDDECKNVSSSGIQKCGTKTHERTVIPIGKTVETEIINGDKAQECKGCPDIGKTTIAPVTTPPTTPVPCTSTTPQTPTVPTIPSTITTTKPPASQRTPHSTTSTTAPYSTSTSTVPHSTTTTTAPRSMITTTAPCSTTTTTAPRSMTTTMAPRSMTTATAPRTMTTTNPDNSRHPQDVLKRYKRPHSIQDVLRASRERQPLDHPRNVFPRAY
uniref:Putative cell wall protein dan4 n=1 Tax=Ixodes ricinus TaxID=34613 RepID=A0A090XBS1_IXORI